MASQAVFGQLVGQAIAANAGVVEQNVDAAKSLGCRAAPLAATAASSRTSAAKVRSLDAQCPAFLGQRVERSRVPKP